MSLCEKMNEKAQGVLDAMARLKEAAYDHKPILVAQNDETFSVHEDAGFKVSALWDPEDIHTKGLEEKAGYGDLYTREQFEADIKTVEAEWRHLVDPNDPQYGKGSILSCVSGQRPLDILLASKDRLADLQRDENELKIDTSVPAANANQFKP